MKWSRLAFSVSALLGIASAASVSWSGEVAVDAVGPRVAPSRIAVPRGLPPFALQLLSLPPITGPGGWRTPGQVDDWAGLIAAGPQTRQAARWAYATRQIDVGRGAEAIGALTVMRQDDPELSLVASYRLALGAALMLLDRPADATAALAGEALQSNPEACAWRMLALVRAQLEPQALGQLRCAMPALNARKVKDRARFALAAARAAASLRNPGLSRQLVDSLPADDPAANLMRGRAEIALGNRLEGRMLLAKAARMGSREQRLDAELSVLEDAVQRGAWSTANGGQLRDLRFVWRGGDVEMRALQLGYLVARRQRDLRATLDAGATLLRYFGGGKDRSALVVQLQETLITTLGPDNPLPLDQVAGLYWDYRDLSPAGGEGDMLVTRLADRLQAAGLYERGAELLDHQLRTRMRDVAQGPVSARVASLFILAGQPKRALAAIRDTEGSSYPDDMLWARHRVEAVALDQLGRFNEALAVLQDVPDGAAIRDELHWRRHDWEALASVPPPAETSGAMNDVAQARILRLAVALAMLGREAELADLRARYARAFAGLPTAPAFAALTAPIEAIDPATISAAMAAIPSASPAGDIADLIDAAPSIAGRAGA